ncbi:MAG: hypothetical protein U0791_26710 [Gemmataceae bacterium]
MPRTSDLDLLNRLIALLSERHEPSYGDVPCSAELMRYDTKREAEEALADLFDWLSEDPVGCDFSAAKAGA